jgi:2',3'-cyclic-nucleotide 2'-phosphodiesterase (5'-nucleotidase family)
MSQIEFTGVPLGSIANTLVFVQLNDVYQIDAAADYRQPDSLILPRVTTVVERLRQRWGDRLFVCLPGDFLAPSAMSQMYKGKQMVDVLNSIGVDFVCLGNHEFDVDTKDGLSRELLQRIDESRFRWICSNLDPDPAISGLRQKLLSFKVLGLSQDIDVVLIGLLGKMKDVPVTVEPAEAVGKIISDIAIYLTHEYPDRRTELFPIALTHQDVSGDRKLALAEKRLHLILGGHDHEVVEVPTSECVIAKACSNARTIRLNFIISLPSAVTEGALKVMDRKSVMAAVADELVDQCVAESIGIIFSAVADDDPIADALVETAGPVVHFVPGCNDTTFILSVGVKTDHPLFLERVPCSEATKNRIQDWVARANAESKPVSFAQRIGIAPTVLTLQDRAIRRESTNFGVLTAEVLRNCWTWCGHDTPPADVGLINGGTFRLDRDIQMGEWITQRTLCEIFYFENEIAEYTLTGRDLLDLLNNSHERRSSFSQQGDAEGDGQFVQIAGIRVACRNGRPIGSDKVSLVKAASVLELDRKYRVVTTDYLATRGPYAGLFRKPPIQTAPLKLRSLVAKFIDWILAEAQSGRLLDGSQGWVDADK